MCHFRSGIYLYTHSSVIIHTALIFRSLFLVLFAFTVFIVYLYLSFDLLVYLFVAFITGTATGDQKGGPMVYIITCIYLDNNIGIILCQFYRVLEVYRQLGNIL